MEKYYYTNCFGKENCQIKLDTGLDKLGLFGGGGSLGIASGGSTSTKDTKPASSDGSSSSSSTQSTSGGSTSSTDKSKTADKSKTNDKSKVPDSSSSNTAQPSSSSKGSGSSSSIPSSGGSSPSDSKTTSIDGKKRVLTSLLGAGITPAAEKVDMLSELSPICKSIVLGRVFKSKYSDAPT